MCGSRVTHEMWDYLRQQPVFVDLICMWRPEADKVEVLPLYNSGAAHVVGMILLGIDAIKNKGALPTFVLPSLHQHPSRVDGVYKMIAAIRAMHTAPT